MREYTMMNKLKTVSSKLIASFSLVCSLDKFVLGFRGFLCLSCVYASSLLYLKSTFEIYW